MKPKHKLVVLIPIYNDYQAVRCLVRDLHALYDADCFRVILVDDGSRAIDEEIEVQYPNVKILPLKRNLGHQKALAVGMCHIYAKYRDYDFIVTMDGDGEDAPASIAKLYEHIVAHNADVVVAERLDRVETLKFKLFYKLYKLVFSALTGNHISWGNFMIFTPKALERFVCMGETSFHFPGAVLCSKLEFLKLPLKRAKRYFGVSKMNFSSLAYHGFKSILLFADRVQVRIVMASVTIAVLSLTASVLALVLKLSGMASPGWVSSILGFSAVIFLQMVSLSFLSLLLNRSNAYSTPPLEWYQLFLPEDGPADKTIA